MLESRFIDYTGARTEKIEESSLYCFSVSVTLKGGIRKKLPVSKESTATTL